MNNQPASSLATPSDGETLTEPNTIVPKKRRTPRRFQLFDDGGGDFRIYEIVGPGSKVAPAGSLVPLPEFGGFPDAIAAKKALRTNGDKLQGKQVMIYRGVEIVKIMVETRPQIRIESKERKQVSGPVAPAAGS
jgi:hypothetical protein